eukprot:RCo048811
MGRWTSSFPSAATSLPPVLSEEDELDLLVRCEHSTAQIRLRLDFLKARWSGSGDPARVTELRPGTFLVGGQPWLKAAMLSSTYAFTTAPPISRVHYRAPKHATEEDCLKLFFTEDELLLDEESGTNRQLGFVFLFELARGNLPLTLLGANVSPTLAVLLGQWFYLK